MNAVVDTIMIILFVLFLTYIVAGFMRQQVDKHHDKMDMLDEREKKYQKKLKKKDDK
jgi:flagellar biogenesis protein FliO